METKRNPTPKVNTAYGAPMGRRDASYLAYDEVPMKVSLRKIRLDSGGYDPGGAYWGHGGEGPLYWAGSDCGLMDQFFRAKNRQAARAYVLAKNPLARFYR